MRKLPTNLLYTREIRLFNEIFDKYGPPIRIYTNLKDAITNAGKVFTLKLENQKIDPKLVPKLASLTEFQALELNSNGITQLPMEFNKLKKPYLFCIHSQSFYLLCIIYFGD